MLRTIMRPQHVTGSVGRTLRPVMKRVEEAKLLVSQGASIYIENKEEKHPTSGQRLGLILKRMVES